MMGDPVRLRLSRAKGFRLADASMLANGRAHVVVARPSIWGNPFRVGVDGDQADCVLAFERLLLGDRDCMANADDRFAAAEYAIRFRYRWGELRGFNLACWCALDAPCHADVLLRLANRPIALRAVS